MSYWLCPSCETASVSWPALGWHFKGKHRGEEIPKKEEVQMVEELPDGYRVIGQRQSRKARQAAGVIEGIEQEEGAGPEEEVVVPKELPDDFTERVKLSLNVHNFPGKLTSQILNVLALHSEAHDNPNNFANLLAHICSTFPGGAVHARKISLIISEVFGPPSAEVPYAGVYGSPPAGFYGWPQPGAPQAGFYGWPQPGAPPYHQDPITQWISYQMAKESKGPERTSEATLSPELEARLSEQERYYQETAASLNAVLERLAKQEEAEKEATHKAEIADLRAEIRAASESKKEGGSEWLQAYLTQRDKNEERIQEQYQATVKELGEKLAEATKEVSETRRDIDRKVAEAITSERTVREQAKKELEAAGYAPKTKTQAELDHDLFAQGLSIIPDKIDKGFDKIADRIAPITTQAAATPAPEATAPRSPQEIAEQIALEEDILGEASRRGKA